VFVFPGEDGIPEGVIPALGGGAAQVMRGNLDSGESITRIERGDFEHPLFEGVFEAGNEGEERLENPAVYAHLPYQNGTGDERTLVALSNGEVFLQELRHGTGKTIVCMSAADPRWTELPMRGLFVPLLYRSLFFLTSSGEEGEMLELGQQGLIRVQGAGVGDITMETPDGTEYVLDGREVADGVLAMLPRDLSVPGIHTIRRGDDINRRIAINLPRRESDLHQLEQSEAVNQLEHGTGVAVYVQSAGADPEEIGQRVIESRFGVELWRSFVVAALLLLLAEMAISMRWRPVVDESIA